MVYCVFDHLDDVTKNLIVQIKSLSTYVCSAFISHFEAVAECNHWSNEEKATTLILALQVNAFAILPGIPTERQKNHATAVAALVTRFGSHHLQQLCI